MDPLVGIDQLLVRNDRRLVSALLVFLLAPLFWFLGLDLVLFGNDWPRLRERLLVRGISILVPVVALLVVRTAAIPQGLLAARCWRWQFPCPCCTSPPTCCARGVRCCPSVHR